MLILSKQTGVGHEIISTISLVVSSGRLQQLYSTEQQNEPTSSNSGLFLSPVLIPSLQGEHMLNPSVSKIQDLPLMVEL